MSEKSSRNENRFHYPVALDVSGRHCVVVGGGTVGIRKATALTEAGAIVTIVAPSLCPEASLLVNSGAVRYQNEPFAPIHLENAFLVIVATDSPVVNAEVGRIAASRNILVNMAAPGDGDSGDFATMATVQRGDLLVSVTTGGAGPALSARIRRELAEQFGKEWEPVVSLLAEMRQTVKETVPDATNRTATLRSLAENAGRFASLYKNGEGETARQEALTCLNR